VSGTAFYTLADDGAYVPTTHACSAWSRSALNGPSIVAALARTLELEHGAEGFHPARLTVDLFAAVRFAPLAVVTGTVREGNRIRVADATLVQDGEGVARATLVQLRLGEQPPGDVWRSGREFEIPAAVADAPLRRGDKGLFSSDGSVEPWTTDLRPHQGGTRKRFWNHPRDVVEGEPATAFQRAASLAESTSLVTNWGSEGIGFINADLTVTLARLPRSGDIGIEASDHVSAAGVAVGTAALYDRDGQFGTGSVVAVSNAERQIDFTTRDAVGGFVRSDGEGDGS
jgi:hypothetical protein